MDDSTEGFGGERDQAELDQAEAMRQLQHELASAPPIEVVAQAVAHLATLAYVRLGVPPQENQRYQDLEAARVLIDALGGMLDAVEGRLGARDARAASGCPGRTEARRPRPGWTGPLRVPCGGPGCRSPFDRKLLCLYASGRTFEACGPLGPLVISNSTVCPSVKVLYPSI